ncbi:MAG: beta-propeller fold lactonase family protein [Nitriliruptorales bacterium]|nr:beta-propeller fold lactonase family protein [Nitriliruptorales bacterium]
MSQNTTTTPPRRRRRGVAAVLAGVGLAVIAVTALASPSTGQVTPTAGPSHDYHVAGPGVGRSEPAARIYTVTPSSEPDRITGPSQMKVFDPRSLDVTTTVDVPDFRPHHFYPVPGRNIAIQAHFGPTSNIELFDMVSNTYIGRLSTGLGPRHVSFDPSSTFAYSANFNGNSISVLDLNSRRSVATIPVGEKPNYVQYVKTARGPRLFVENFGGNTITVIDARNLRPVTTVTVGDGPFNASIAEGGRTLVTANARDNTATFVDTATLEVTDTVDLGGVHDPTVGMQRLNPRISPDGKWLWVGNQDASVFSIVNIPERRLETMLPAGRGADIAFFPAGGPARGLALLTNRYDDFVTVARLNGQQPPTVVKNMTTSALGSHFVTFNEDFSLAYVSQRPGRAFSVLDMATLTERANVPVGPGPVTDPAATDPSQAGPDQAFYVWFDRGRARFHDEHGCG